MQSRKNNGSEEGFTCKKKISVPDFKIKFFKKVQEQREMFLILEENFGKSLANT
jgi:hypothetical protein